MINWSILFSAYCAILSSIAFAADHFAADDLVADYNAAIKALYSNQPDALKAAEQKLQKTFNAHPVDNQLNLSEAYVSTESLLDRLQRMDKVKKALNSCSFVKCAPTDQHCVDLAIEKQVLEDSKNVTYCESSSSANSKNIGVVITALKSENTKSKPQERSASCTLVRSAQTEFLLNRVKSLMRMIKRYHTSFFTKANPSDSEILNKAVSLALQCGPEPSSYCKLVKATLEEKGAAFLKDQVHGLGKIKRVSNQDVADGLNRSFRGLNILYLDSEGDRAEKCKTSGYSDLTEKKLKEDHKALESQFTSLNQLYAKLAKNPSLRTQYDSLYAKYIKDRKVYEAYESKSLSGFKKYRAFCDLRAERKYGYGGTANGHTWIDRRNILSPTDAENKIEIENYQSLVKNFSIDYLRLLNSPDGALLTTDRIGDDKHAFKTLKNGPYPSGAIDENLSAEDVKEAVVQATKLIQKDLQEMQKKFPFETSTAKTSGCENHLTVLTEKDPMAISKAVMDYPEFTSTICGPINAVNMKAQLNEDARRVVRAGTYVALGVGAFMTGGALLGASPALIAAAASADATLSVALTAGSVLNYVDANGEYKNAELQLLSNQASGKKDDQVASRVLASKANKAEEKVNIILNGTGLGTRVIGKTIQKGTQLYSEFNVGMQNIVDAGVTDGVAAFSREIISAEKEASVLACVENHIKGTSFFSSATEKTPGGLLKLSQNKSIQTDQLVRIELNSFNGKRIQKITLLDEAGVEMGNLPCVKEKGICIGGDHPIYTIPVDHKIQVRYSYEDGTIVTAKSTDIKNNLPEGARFNIKANNTFRKKGFSGAHTQSGWDKIMEIYGNKITILETRASQIKIPGSDKIYEFQDIYYSFDGIEVPNPKSVFMGADAELTEIGQKLTKTIKEKILADPTAQSIEIPLEGGKMVIYRDPKVKTQASPLGIYTWFVTSK